jgi:hypothetical protein
MTPDNIAYFQAAVAFAAVIYGGYIMLLRWRERSLAERERVVESSTSARADGGKREGTP